MSEKNIDAAKAEHADWRNKKDGIAPVAASLNLDDERAKFEAWANDAAIRTDLGAWEAWQAARRTPPAEVSADTLPALPNRDGDWAGDDWYTANTLSEYAKSAIARYAEQIKKLERNQLPNLADGEDEVSFLGDGKVACTTEARYWELRAAEERVAELERELVERKQVQSANPMCKRKTNDIIQREGYRKTGYVLMKDDPEARICVSDQGAVSWFTRDQWNWLMHNRDHVEFTWPKPLGHIDGRSAGTTPAEAEIAKVAEAPRSREWQQVTEPGQVRKGDKLRFKIGDKAYNERAKLILHPGTDKEEVIYDKGRNFYFITAMVMSGFSNHKFVEVLAGAPSLSTGESKCDGDQ